VKLLHPLQVPDHELLAHIGHGAYGEVLLARSVTGAYRAVKIVSRQSFDNDRPYEREFSGIQNFEPISREHESQVDILHVGRAEGCFYYVMELADDQATGQAIDPASYAPRTLKSELFHRGHLPFEECVNLTLALTTALEHLHSHGLVHRDIKPSNIIFVNGVPKLADIGLVTGVDATRSFVGTEGFAPPEGPGTVQADLYSLGKVLYEMSTGKDRQDFPELPTRLAELPDNEGLVELNAVIAKACRADPQARYQSAKAMHDELLLLQSGKSLARVRTLERALAKLRRVSMAGATVAVVVTAALIYQAHQTRIVNRLALKNSDLANINRQAASEARNRAYASDMGLAQEALRVNNFGRAWAILDRQRPRTDQEDLRGFEWRYLWSLCRGSELYTFQGHSNNVSAVAISPGTKLLATASFDDNVRIWDLKTYAPIVVLTNPHSSTLHAQLLAFSPDGNQLATADSEGVVVWDVKTWQPFQFLTAGLQQEIPWAGSLFFSSDGRWLLGRAKTGIKV
jgi:serine/threonine protein kinase